MRYNLRTPAFLDLVGKNKMKNTALITFSLIALATITACSSIKKKDCQKDMYTFGMEHGREGLNKKLTSEIVKRCSSEEFTPDVLKYEAGFMKGWEEYCLPNRAYKLGQKGDRYVSFCPVEREEQFREKYLIGKQYNELTEHLEEIEEKLTELKKEIGKDPLKFNEYQKIEKYSIKVKQDIQKIEIQGLKDNFYFDSSKSASP